MHKVVFAINATRPRVGYCCKYVALSHVSVGLQLAGVKHTCPLKDGFHPGTLGATQFFYFPWCQNEFISLKQVFLVMTPGNVTADCNLTLCFPSASYQSIEVMACCPCN